MSSHFKRLDKRIDDTIERAKQAKTKAEVDVLAKSLEVIVKGAPGKDADDTTDPPTPAIPKKEPWALIRPRHTEKIDKALKDVFPALRAAAADDAPVEAPAETPAE